MNDVAVFLAHALALEEEAADRYDELADTMAVHHNDSVGDLFRRMANFSRMHADAVRGRAANVELPHFKPWEYQWDGPEGAETGSGDRTHYLITPYHCLQFALANERRGRDFYAGIAQSTSNDEVRRLAGQMATEESEHVLVLEQWLAQTPRPAPDWDADPDPPVVND